MVFTLWCKSEQMSGHGEVQTGRKEKAEQRVQRPRDQVSHFRGGGRGCAEDGMS